LLTFVRCAHTSDSNENAPASIQDAGANLGNNQSVLTPSPSPTRRPAPTIKGGAGH
jgi:hypothetical protein